MFMINKYIVDHSSYDYIKPTIYCLYPCLM